MLVSFPSRTSAHSAKTKLVCWPWYYCACLASQLAWAEPHRESMEHCQEEDERHLTNNTHELKAAIKATWASITPQQCHKLTTSMPHHKRCISVNLEIAPTEIANRMPHAEWKHVDLKKKQQQSFYIKSDCGRNQRAYVAKLQWKHFFTCTGHDCDMRIAEKCSCMLRSPDRKEGEGFQKPWQILQHNGKLSKRGI